MSNRAQVTVQNVQTIHDLKTVFHLPINDAAKKLGLCVTVLKQKCREFGVLRWPFRKVKKINTLIKQLEEEKEKVLSGEEEGTFSQQSVKEEGENSNAEGGSTNVSNEEEEEEKDDIEKEEEGEEEKMKKMKGNKVGGGEERRGSAPSMAQKVILEDIENRLHEILKMRDELYVDPNSNVHLLPNSIGGVVNSGVSGASAEKRGESNNGRSPSCQQAKAAKTAAAATAVQEQQHQLQDNNADDNDDNVAKKKRTTIASRPPPPKLESDERMDVVQNEEVSLSAVPEEEKNKIKSSFRRLWQRKENVIEKAMATPTRPTLKRQDSNSSSGKDSGSLFDALLNAATVLDTTRKNAGKGKKAGNENNDNNDDDYNLGKSNEEVGQDELPIGSPRKVRRSHDLQRSVRPPSLDIPREKVLERPNSVPLNINHISEADVAAGFYQQMQLQQAQNAVAAAAAMQAAMATSMNPSQSIPLMYQVPYSLQHMNLNSKMMQLQWDEMSKNMNTPAVNNVAGMSLLERRAAEAAASMGRNIVAPSSLDLKIPTVAGEGAHSGAYFPYYGEIYSPTQQQYQQQIMMPVQHQSAASEDNSYLETDAENTAAEKASRSCVGTPKSIGAFPGSNRTSFEGQQGYPSPTSQTTGIHRPVALKRGHLELQSNQLV
mmetsp:Transcript_1493/g.4544  ORF Transcript_1493/g.4544 Transcript_1493/m.4544 type:complete len:659 (+) Transcript_1493:114-2090(+)